ncbi:hypothetical protein ACFRCW_30275 [Streptomyces sp. NPDC056653]|uniref:hypothetical protein n=1 Tax=Streptomyces sp. NPDC056653 TaxID=3345894 RepID=UPI00369E87F0
MTDRDAGFTGLHLALQADGDGAHPAAWRYSGRPPGADLTPGTLRNVVAAAEDAGFSLVTFADSPLPPGVGPGAVGRVEPEPGPRMSRP